MAALHGGLIMMCLMLAFAGFVFWPRLDGVPDLLVPLLAGVAALSSLLNGRALWRQIKAFNQRQRAPSPDLIAFAVSMVTIYLASRLFTPLG